VATHSDAQPRRLCALTFRACPIRASVHIIRASDVCAVLLLHQVLTAFCIHFNCASLHVLEH
jgi:hypothetical protein